jgi:hypothetical protein
MAFTIPAVQFTVKVTGEVTGEEFVGTFKSRPALPFALQLEEDRIRRELLGDRPESAGGRALNAASIFAFLTTHLTEAPMWWKESANGQTLFDDNVVAAVYGEAVKISTDFQADLRKKADEAKKDLERMATKQE